MGMVRLMNLLTQMLSEDSWFWFWSMKFDNAAEFTCSKSTKEIPRTLCKICSKFEQGSHFFF